MNIHGTIEEIVTLDQQLRKSRGRLVVLFDSLKRVSEIMGSLSEDEREELARASEENPILKAMIINEATTPYQVSQSFALPSFLTVSDVSEMLGITPQVIRRYCADKRIAAWRTLGDSGEWRIDIEQYKTHSNFQLIAARYMERNHKVSEMIANNEVLTNQLRNAEARKNDSTYYNNDIERFNKLVDETE